MTTPTLLPTGLAAEAVSLGYGSTVVVNDVSLVIRPGEVTSIVGPNGSGKSTFVRALAGLVTPQAGRVMLDGRDLATQRPRETARRIGFLPQSLIAPEHITVKELVGHGRDPHRRWFEAWSAHDSAAVESALELTDMTGLADHPVDELSGGQRQRAWIALTLAQTPGILILDEPTTYLDIAHQLDTLELVSTLVRERGTTVMLVLHDLTMAARYSDTVVAMHEGRIAAQGVPRDVFTPETLERVFDIRARIDDSVEEGLVVVPTRRVGTGSG
ncbi:ABC transporter ATP-binding protein [Microbacterium sp. cx-55]|uniref:ABC transporter ATP-binding protein n=1 Tax=Microbacterium sp. cx-55 TaxID=2875948 RepID=UPI001CC194A5|nr:ABC transporter ATP-binding protein [Microbacterium sp. cx-55]MBZ4486730.1 ABC transporter ATP-binding protein [Microbacterium sp. cx-55]UGB36312.1 ABC transporter ATP-binding protein [Microbacterium sp. cx-55]